MRFVALSCALLVACPAPKHPSLPEFCTSYVNAVCGRLAECRGGPAEAWCSRLSADRLCREVAISEAAGRTKYQGEYHDACFLIVADLPCKYLAARGAAELDVVCSEALNGLVPPMGACFADRECGRDYHCDRSATRCPGVCRRLREHGEACDALTGTRCNTGFTCIGGACAVPKQSGEACADSLECGAGLSCDAFVMPVSCQAERAIGACRPGGADCAPRAACTTDGDAGTCATAKQENDACVAGRAECNDLLSCVAGACARWGGLGAACGELSPGERAGCLQGGCVVDPGMQRGVCVERDAGAACELDAQCGPGGQCLGTPRTCMSRCAPR